MTSRHTCVPILLCLWAGAAQAQFSATVDAVSDYEFRGVSLTAEDPALQASLDYAFDSGFAVGAWASNIDYGSGYDGEVELDLYADYTAALSDTTSWSAGFALYTYPGSSGAGKIEPSLEGYLGLGVGSFSGRHWYTHDYGGLGASAQYTELNYTFALSDSWSVMAHAGYSWGEYFEDELLGGDELFDYSLGVAFVAGRFTVSGKYVDTDASGELRIDRGAFANDARVVLSVSMTVP